MEVGEVAAVRVRNRVEVILSVQDGSNRQWSCM